ncbi:MAG: AMP-binding protein [Ignavibacteriaceae bacterium]
MKTTSNYFWQNLKYFSDRIALIDTSDDNSVTYNDLDIASDDIASRLKLSKKGLVFLFTTNNIESIITYIAVLKSGNAVLLLDEKLNEEIRIELINNYKPEFIITSREFIHADYAKEYNYSDLKFYKRNKILIFSTHDELSVLLSTSGTTGSPKLVRLAYKNIQSNAESIAEYLKIDESEKPITTLPFSYSYGLSVINSHLLKGATIVLTEKTVFFRDFWNLFNELNCTSFAGVPYTYTMLKRINFTKIELPTLKYMTQAGGKLGDELIRHFNDFALEKNIKFYVMYGQTEATARITYVPPEILSNKIGSIGIAIPGGKLKIMKNGKEIMTPNEHGEIVYSGNNVMMGYAKIREDLSSGDELKGTLFTGDLGYKDADGFFYVTGRMKRFIKIFGLRINLDDVQKRIENNFSITAACTGTDDLLKILIHSEDINSEIKVKNEVIKMYKLNFNSLVVKSTKIIPTTNSGKYDYKKINELFDADK